MRIVKNCLSEKLFLDIRKDLHKTIPSQTWKTNLPQWQPNLLIGIRGSCLSTESIDSSINSELISELKNYLPEAKKYITQYYMWQYNSGISMHYDDRWKFGATLYLNDRWYYDAGGLFIWINKHTDAPHVILPERNMLVVNDVNEEHMVTQLSSDLPEFRYTIQIWGTDE